MWTPSYTRSYISSGPTAKNHASTTPTQGTSMSDRYQSFSSSPIGQMFVKNLGLPAPEKLERYTEGAPLVDGTVVVGGNGRLAATLTTTLDNLGIASTTSPSK